MSAPPSGKWIEGLTGHTPVEDAARLVLDARLSSVVHHLGKALKEPFEDPEHVHQVRVSARRAVAALDIFAPCLPRKVYRCARRSIRDVRRAAGAARDWDVFLPHLPIELPKRSLRRQPGIDFLAGYALGQRLEAQKGLEEAGTDYPEAFEQLVQETRNAVREPEEGPSALAELGRAHILPLLQELEQATAQDLGDYVHLHRLRIIGKRLRYAMEIFVDCYPPPFRETLYPKVEEMQDILGRANDSFVAEQRLRQLSIDVRTASPDRWKRFRPALDHLIRFHAKWLPKGRANFEHWWAEWRESQTDATFAVLLQSAEAGIASK